MRSSRIFKFKEFLNLSILILFCLVFLGILSISFLHTGVLGDLNCDYVEINKFGVFLLAILFLGGIFLFYHFLKVHNFSKKTLKIFSIGFFFLFLGGQVLSFFLTVHPTWDFSMIYYGALNSIQDHMSVDVWRYLSQFPNNLTLFGFELIFFKLASWLEIQNFFYVGIFVNVLFIDLAVLFLFLFLKKVYSWEMGIVGLLFCIFLTPLFLYTPIFYSDTFSVFLPIFLLYCYSFVRGKEWDQKNILFCFLIAFGTVLGIGLKFTVVITTIAIFIDWFLQVKWQSFWRHFCVFLLSFCFVFFFYQYGKNALVQHYQLSHDLQIPYTHWIMMGMHEKGGYNGADYDRYPKDSTFEEKKLMSVQNIQDTLKEYGFWGYLRFLNQKVYFTWGDGTYYVSLKLTREPMYKAYLLSDLIHVNGKFHKEYLYFANGVHYGLLLLLFISAWVSFRQKIYDRIPMFLSIMGLFLFLLIWETRSRYLYHYIPVFIAAAIPVFEFFSQKWLKRQRNI